MHTQTLHGMPVTISSPVKNVQKVKRSWMERLLTFPFKPFTKYREVVEWKELVEDGKILQFSGGLLMSGKTWKDVCDSIK